MAPTGATALRGLAVVATLGFLAVLGWYLRAPGYTATRLALFAALGGFAVVGAAGIARQRERLAVAGIAGVFLLGFWQAVLWVYVLPLLIVFVVAAVVTADLDPVEEPVAE